MIGSVDPLSSSVGQKDMENYRGDKGEETPKELVPNCFPIGFQSFKSLL